jgi:23S rRNA (uracil1939-C5)-methyltransferase
VRVVEIKKNFGTGELIKINSASPARREAPCPVFGRCGGCTWQHINYDEQLRQKHAILAHSLRLVLPKDMVIPEVTAAENEFRYRNRIQIHLQNGQRGFFAASTNKIIPVDDCLIAEEALLKDLDLSSLELRNAKKVELSLDENGRRQIRDVTASDVEFTQVNTEINEKLKDVVCAYVKEFSAASKIYDLYCGHGNLTFALLATLSQAHVIGVELAGTAIQLAKKRNAFGERAEFIAKDVETFLRTSKRIDETSVFVLDPPRAGLGSACTEILRLMPSCLVYVSCNLATLARDLQKLCSLYEIRGISALDMFPQTEYLETVVVLTQR